MSRKWASIEAEAVRWRETEDKGLLEGLIERLFPFAERKIQAFLAGKGLHAHLDSYGQEITSWALFAVWRALATWEPQKASLAHWLSLYSFGFAGRLLSKIRLDTVSLFEPVQEGEEATLLDTLPSLGPGPEEVLFRRVLQEALATLPERHRDVLKRRLQGQTLEEIGQELGLSRERVRQLETLAIRKLKGDAKAKK